jgi:prolyl oligopeptidase
MVGQDSEIRHYQEGVSEMQQKIAKARWSCRGGRACLGPVLAAAIIASTALWAQALPPPPATKVVKVVDTLHGVEIVDPYRWLEDQESPETRAWLEAQNKYMRSVVDSLPGREKLVERIAQLYKIDRVGIPIERNGRYFFSRRSADQEQYIIYMREGIAGADQVVIDPHPMSPDHSVSVAVWDATDDGKILAYHTRHGGEDEVVVKLFDVDKRENLPDSLPRGRYFGFSFKKDLSGFYYSRHTDEGPEVYYHAMGTDPKDDEMFFGEGYGPVNGVACDVSENGRWLLLHVFFGSSGIKSEIYYQDLAKGGPISRG